MSGLVEKVDAVMAKYMDYPNPKYGSRLIVSSAIIRAVSEWLAQEDPDDTLWARHLIFKELEGSE